MSEDQSKPRRHAFAWGVTSLCVALVQACAGTVPAFSPDYPDNRTSDVQELMQRIDGAPLRKSSAIAIGATRAGLYAFELDRGKLLWQQALAPSSAPLLAGPYAVVQVGKVVEGFSLQNGERSFQFDAEGKRLQGADGEGDCAAITTSEGQGTLARSDVALVCGGSVRWRRPIAGQGGVPALIGSVVLVPWSTQFLSALEREDGREIARLRVRDGVISHALRAAGSGAGSFIGSFHGVAHLSAAIASGSLKRAGVLSLPERELPGRPPLLPDVHAEIRGARIDGAEHRIGVAFAPALTGKDRVAWGDDTLYLFFYRFVYGLDPRDAKVRWVRVLDADAVGARACAGGVLVGDERGAVSLLAAASGETRWTRRAGVGSSVWRFPEGITGGRIGRAPDASGLRAQLVAAIQAPDSRLAPARVFAVEQLASLSQPEVTADLVSLCDSDSLTPPVRERACLELRQRPNGSEAVLTALRRHAGHLEGTTSPQVGSLATAAASLRLAQSVPLLIGHLEDPATRSSDLPALINALADLGDSAAVPALTTFFQLYHADPVDAQLVRAVQSVPGALVKLHAASSQPALRAVATDELGIYSVRQQARGAAETLSQPTPEPAPKAEAPAPAASESAAAEPPPAEPEAGALPTRITAEMVDSSLAPFRDELLACLNNHAPALPQARVLLVVSDQHAQTVSVMPNDVQGCIEPLIRALEFPATTARTPERLSYTLKP